MTETILTPIRKIIAHVGILGVAHPTSENVGHDDRSPIRFAWDRTGRYSLFGAFSFDEFMDVGKRLAEVVGKVAGPTRQTITSFESEALFKDYEFHSSGFGSASAERELLAQRPEHSPEQYSRNQYQKAAQVQFNVYPAKERKPYLTDWACISVEGHKKFLRFYYQGHQDISLKIIDEFYKRPGRTHQPRDAKWDFDKYMAKMQEHIDKYMTK